MPGERRSQLMAPVGHTPPARAANIVGKELGLPEKPIPRRSSSPNG
jgi:hypothetical protein